MVSLASKTTLPQLRQPVIERSDLLEELKHILEHKLTLIVAPPGYGKTTIVAQFAHQTTVPVLWHTLEERERDFPNLFAHTLTTFTELLPEIEALQKQPIMTPGEAANRLLESLYGALFSDLVYVVDDVQNVIGSPNAERWLRIFIEGLSPKLHIVLIGRALPPLPLMDMIARREVMTLGQAQLRFTFPEIQKLAQELNVVASPLEMQKIVKQFDGWAAGTILALRPLPIEVEQAVFQGKRAPEALFDALAEVMLHAQDELLQEFLLASSTLPRMTPTLCQGALQLPDSRQRLEDVLSNNLFVSQLPGAVVYHPLFRDFLQRYLQSHNPERFTELHKQAARWFEDNNRLDEAFDRYVSAACWGKAVDIAERAAQIYFSQGKAETVLYWLSQLSHRGIEFPQLLYNCAVIYVDRYEYDLAIEALTEAAQGYQNRRDEAGLLTVHLLQANIDNLRGQYQSAIQQTQALLERRNFPPNLRGYASFILGTAYLYLGDIPTAMQHFESALPLYRASGDAYTLSELLLSLEFAYMRIGRFDAAHALLQEAIGIRRMLGNSSGLIPPLNNLGYDFHLLGDYDRALSSFDEALQITNRVSEKRAESHLLWSMGDLQRDRGAFDEAASLYHKALQKLGSSEPWTRCSILVSFSTLRRWQGKLEDALAFAAEAATLAEKHRLLFETLNAQLCVWAIRAQGGEPRQAQQELETLAEVFHRQQEPTRWAQSLVVRAYAALLSHDTVAASRNLKAAVEGVAHETHLQPAVAEIVHTPLLKAFVVKHHARFPSLIKGIKRLDAATIEEPLRKIDYEKTSPIPTFSLRIWMLGQEQTERDGKLLSVSAWRAEDARELLYYLLLKGATSREQIGLVFWPDSSPSQVRGLFHSALHRLRSAVGTNAVQFEDELYFTNPDLDLWCDTLEFGSLVQEARLTSPLRVHTENLLRRAVDLYQGELLPSLESEWVVSLRESLQQTYLEALFALGNCIRVRGDLQGAMTVFQRALAVDPYREDIHRAILTCYEALGDRTAIHRQLQTLTRLLGNDLGITPSVETISLAQALLN